MKSFYRLYGKRAFDFAVSAAALAVASPVLAAVTVLVRWKLGSPVLFTQERPGREGKPFQMVKFRTMTSERDALGALLPDAERLTAFGRLLRSTSMDELPELWNVVKGDMSIVGPRPLLMRYMNRYTPEQLRRHDVRPGVTGLAQISGRNNIPWEKRFAIDVEYVDSLTFKSDMRIIGLTIGKVVRRSDISSEGEATMSEFMGARPITETSVERAQ